MFHVTGQPFLFVHCIVLTKKPCQSDKSYHLSKMQQQLDAISNNNGATDDVDSTEDPGAEPTAETGNDKCQSGKPEERSQHDPTDKRRGFSPGKGNLKSPEKHGAI